VRLTLRSTGRAGTRLQLGAHRRGPPVSLNVRAQVEAIELVAAIDRAFPREPLPTVSLRQAVLADQGISRQITDQEWEAERQLDGQLHWSELSDESLVACRDGLAHLTEESFAYYLGAFLSFAIRNIDANLVGLSGELLGSVVFSVTNRSNYNLGRLKRLSDAQIDCVIQFLAFVSQHSETHASAATKALARYWLKPEARRKTVVHVP